MKSAFFFGFTQRRMVVSYQRLGQRVCSIFKGQAVQQEVFLVEHSRRLHSYVFLNGCCSFLPIATAACGY